MKNNLGKVVLGITALTLTSILVQAKAHASNLIDLTYGMGAGSFELGGIENFVPNAAPDAMRNPSGNTDITGWVVGSNPDGGVNWIRETSFQAHTGAYSVDLQDLSAGSIFTKIPTTPGSRYTVSFAATTV